MFDTFPTISTLRTLLKSKEISAVEILEYLEQKIIDLDPSIGAYIERDTVAAKKEALAVDITKPLGGIPIGIKDAILVAGSSAQSASRILQNFISPYSATVIQKLRSAGAIPFGRMNMDEFAMGSSTENSSFFPTRNPWDLKRIPGGSSGGSAAAVAAGTAIATLGSDTGGSIRQPAALCGCVGLKPTYGRVSRYGLIAFASSLDQIGPITSTVLDNAILLNELVGHDPHDETTVMRPKEDFVANLNRDIRGLRVGIPSEYFQDGIHTSTLEIVTKAIKKLEELGAEIVEISLPHTEYAVATYQIIATAEASTNLARFDGIRYGRRVNNPKNIHHLYSETRAEGFGKEVKRRIILGTYVLSGGYYDAYYLQAQKVRTLIREDFNRAFSAVDIIVAPTSPETAFLIGEKVNDPLKMYLADIFTIPSNLGGICAVSIPCGFSKHGGIDLPVGIQLLGKSFDESTILRVAYAYEQATNWFQYHPSYTA